MSKNVTIIGATGLIGSELLSLLQEDPDIEKINVLVRRKVDIKHPKVNTLIIDFDDQDAFKNALQGSDSVFCAVGTTTKKVKGDKAAYRKVDYDIPVNACTYAAANGATHFLVVSSVGADSQSNNFYLQLKGEMEDALKALSIPSVSIFRPSMLLGNRNEFRLGEKIGQVVMQGLKFLIPTKYKPIKAHDVALGMLIASKKGDKGIKVYLNKDIWGVTTLIKT